VLNAADAEIVRDPMISATLTPTMPMMPI